MSSLLTNAELDTIATFDQKGQCSCEALLSHARAANERIDSLLTRLRAAEDVVEKAVAVRRNGRSSEWAALDAAIHTHSLTPNQEPSNG